MSQPGQKVDQRTVVLDGDQLKTCRRQQGLSQETLAQRVGCSKKTIENAERGQPVLLRTASEIATALGVQTATLLIERIPPTQEPPPTGNSSAGAELFRTVIPPGRHRHRKTIVAAVCLSAILLTLGIHRIWTHFRPGASRLSVRSLAVLPFKNIGGNPDWDYFADGVTESMTSRLSGISDLIVISHNVVGRKRDADCQSLHVDAVVMGTIRPFPDSLEATVELIDCSTGKHLWGEHYRQLFKDPLTFEKSAVEDTATQLRARLTSGERKRVSRNYTANIETYRLYLKGRYEWNKRSAEGFKLAIQYFRKVLELDPSNALAYAGIADVYSFESGYLPAFEIFPKAQAAAMKALALDPDLAEAHTSLAFVSLMFGWDWGKAEGEFRTALELNPNYASAHSMYARLLTVLGRFPEAEAELAKAQELDPLSSGIAAGVAYEYYLARDYTRAEKAFQSLLAVNPNSTSASYLAQTRMANGHITEAIHAYEQIIQANPTDPIAVSAMADLVRAYSLAGRNKDATELMRRIQTSPAFDTELPTSLAEAYGALGQLDNAFAALDRAFFERCWNLMFLNVEPVFDPLRQDPRFRMMQQRMGLAKR